FFFLLILPPPSSTLFPYTTLFRSFPLDDIWHRLFGQDVTLWGPTHIQMIAGASLATLALMVLHVEAVRTTGERPRFQKLGWIVGDRKSTRLNSSHVAISYAVFCLK